MAEVGVLNLTIKDNSEQAAAGLTKLADALSRVKAACGTAELNSYSDALKKLKSAIDNGANSYLTLGRLATSLNKVKAASEGFKLPDFRKLENLAKTLQENFNAESGLKRIAEGMEAIKTASEGFKMPDTKGLANVMAAMNGTAGGDGKSSGTSSVQQMAEGFETVTSRIQQANDELLRFADTAESVQRLMSGAELPKLMAGIEAPKLMSAMETPQLMAGETAQRLLPGAEEAEQAGQEMTTALIAVMDNAIIPYPHFDKENAIPTEGSVTEEIEEATQAIIPYDEGMKSIISYAENLENRWDNIAAKMQEASVVAEKVAETVNTAAEPQRPEGWGTGSIRELYASSTGVGPALRGELGHIAKRDAVKEVSENTGLSLAEIHRQIRELGEAAADSKKRIQEMLSSINSPNTNGVNMSQGIDRMMGIGSPSKSAEDSASAFMTDAYKQVQQLMDMLNQPIKMNWSQAIDQLQGVNAQAKSAEDSMSAFLEGMRGDDEMAQKLRELNPELAEVADLGLNARDSLEEVERAEREAADSSGWLKTQIESLKNGFKNMGLTKLANQFLNIAKRMAMRAIIKQFTAGIREGVQNVYFYSKAIGSSFAPSMDNAATALLQMKNSIGAALAPVIQSLIPYLVKVVNVFIKLVNYANQFFSLLAGRSTWTQALPYAAEAFEDTENAARGATSAMKDLLADWDELNIIQSQGGGSGGRSGGNNTDYSQMFTEVSQFSNKIQKIVSAIKDAFGSIWNLVGLIGTAILGWKVASAFSGFIGKLGALAAAGAIIDITLKAVTEIDKQYLETGEEGWLIADLITSLVGSGLAGFVISKAFGASAGVIVAGITMILSAGVSFGIAYADEAGDRRDMLMTLSLIKAGIGTAALAAGFGIATGSALLGLGAAAVVALPLFTLVAGVAIVVKQLRDAEAIAKEAFANTGKNGISVEKIFSALQTEFDKATEGYSIIIDAFSGAAELKTNLSESFETINLLTATVRSDERLTQEEAEAFSKAWTTVFDAFKGLTEQSFDTVFAGLNKSLTSENEEIRKQAKELRVSMLMIEKNISETMATFQLEQEDLAEKIAAGTATQEEMDRYFRNAGLIQKHTHNSQTQLDDIIARGGSIDFGDPEHAIENAQAFVREVKEASDAAIAEIDEGYAAEIQALDTLWDRVELSHDLGYINDAQYNYYKGIFDQTRENFTNVAQEEKDKVSKTAQRAYRMVMDQALKGMLDEGILDENGKLDTGRAMTYILYVMEPLLESLTDAGIEIPEDMKKMFGIGININDWIDQGWFGQFEEYMVHFRNETVTPVDTSEFVNSLGDLESVTQNTVDNVRDMLESLNGIRINFSTTGSSLFSAIQVAIPKPYASGGFVRSGDLVMANENGNFEMMGKMGNQPVVANNQQIVTGISQGVAQANSGVESRLNTIESLLIRMLNKEFVAKAVPSANWGAHNARSNEAYDKVTG